MPAAMEGLRPGAAARRGPDPARRGRAPAIHPAVASTVEPVAAEGGGAGPPPASGPAPSQSPSAGPGKADAWTALATYAGLVAAVFLFLAGLGGGLPWDRPAAPAERSPRPGGAAVAGPAAPGAAAGAAGSSPAGGVPAEPAVPALDGIDGAAGSQGPAPGPGGTPGDAAPSEPDLWQALAERLWGWRAVLRSAWPGSAPVPGGDPGAPAGTGAPPGAGAGGGPGDPGADAGQLGRQLAGLLLEKIAGLRLDEPLTLVAAQFPGEHHLEVFEEEGGPVVGRLAPPDVLAGGLPRFRLKQGDDAGPEVAVAGQEPRVLIYHTHTSEAYVGAVPAGAGFDPAVEAFTSDPGASVVGAGTAIQQVLQERGIGTVHLRQVFDRDGERVTRIGNYQRSLAALVGGKNRPGLLDRYPTVDVVLDVHRDGVGRDATVVQVRGQPAAALLFVVGTDRRLEHSQWQKNYCFVQWIVAELDRRSPGLVKGVLVSENRYNQHVRPGAILVEIGGYGNTPEEADRSARMFAEALAAVIEAGKVPRAGQPFQCPEGVKPPE
ncbi:stage II sporulation protein P [Thermaerobacter marianensis DSM 12885]|uniref:Stage II sporulation protein P n=1 Tax=Thermaerobacter marianensis (strain ATCC 700841 / DSM 12885 / JCM 10246 / 7p75a) TaxID=644966 RepID=E6SKB3_THEM7|nr:stage II sporulation protein P [Thermaerobacter marianensis]ADU52271.1 stage II sporulation protein P [Thermaerobacter marianensis DSM 12885]